MRALPSRLRRSLPFHIGRGVRHVAHDVTTAQFLQETALPLVFVWMFGRRLARPQTVKLSAPVRDFDNASRHEAADRSPRLVPRVALSKSRSRSTPTCLSGAPSIYGVLATGGDA